MAFRLTVPFPVSKSIEREKHSMPAVSKNGCAHTVGCTWSSSRTHCTWSGLLDIAYRNNQPYAFRISDFGAFLLGREATFQPAAPAQGGLKFGSGAPLVLKPVEAHPDLMRLVLRIASPYKEEKASSKKKLVELPFAITLQGLQFMFRAGHRIEDLISNLEAAANEPMPRLIPAVDGRSMGALWETAAVS
jgi:hypothetical protein